MAKSIAVDNVDMELIQIELKELRAKVAELEDSNRVLTDGQAVLSQEVKSVRSGSPLKIPASISGKVDPSLVFCHALQGAVFAAASRAPSMKAFTEHVESYGELILDAASGVLASYLERAVKPD